MGKGITITNILERPLMEPQKIAQRKRAVHVADAVNKIEQYRIYPCVR